jgi:hypothetical protein
MYRSEGRAFPFAPNDFGCRSGTHSLTKMQ